MTLIHCSCIVAYKPICLQHLASTIKLNDNNLKFTFDYNLYDKVICKEAINVPNKKNQTQNNDESSKVDNSYTVDGSNNKVKFEIYGEEMIEKRVKSSGNSGRVYLPPNWVGQKVKIIRI